MDSPNKVKGLLITLLESASDCDETVRKTVSASLIKIGLQNPSLVLSSIWKFLNNPETAPKAHIQSVLYNAAEGIIKEYDENLNEDMIQEWIDSSIKLLLSSSSKDLKLAASSLLVALALTKHHLNSVMTSLIDLFKTNETPHPNIIQAITSIVSCNSRSSAFYFKEIITKLLPYLSNLPNDELRSSTSLMFAKFSESVVDAVANKEPDDVITVEDHNESCSLVCDILLHQWIKTPTITVKNEIILCLSHMSYLLSPDRLDVYSATIVAVILSNYKRNPSPYTISLSLALVCDAVIKMGVESSIKVHLELMLTTLFSQVCLTPNFNEPLTVKNHCEVLRCYDLLAKTFPDTVVSLMIQRLENASHNQRVGALLVIKHLINSHSVNNNNVGKLIVVLNASLTDPNSKVVRTLTQVIVALCHNGYLDVTSGGSFIAFLVKHSAGGTLESRRMNSLNEVGEEFVGNVCCRALNLLASSVTSAVPLLWPRMLQYVTNLEYQNSFPTILSSLASLLQNQSAAVSEIQGQAFAEFGPTSLSYVFMHLLIMCSSPSSSTGISSLTILQCLPRFISPNLIEVWIEHLPQLKETFTSLAVNSLDPSSMQVWQDSLRDFVSCSLENISSDSFTCNLISAQLEQMDVWEKNQAHKCFLVSLFGVSLKQCVNKSLIDSTLNTLFNYVNHKSSIEHESFALCIGICSTNHMAIVLSRIEAWLREVDSVKRSSLSLFYLMKSQDVRSEEGTCIKASLVLCLGQIASLASPEVIGSHVDGPIMLHLLNIMNNNKSEYVNDVTLQTLSKVAKSLLLLTEFELRQRPLLITHVVNTIKHENISSVTLTGCLQVLRDLSALKPVLNVEERTIILQASLSSTLAFIKKSTVVESFLDRCYSQLNVLIRTIIQHDTSPATLDDVTTLLHAWTLSASDLVRIKSLDLLYSSFCTFLQHLVLSHTGPTTFNQTCQLLSILTPRFSDPVPEVRVSAVKSLTLVLKIICRYNGHGPQYTDDDLTSLKALEDGIKEAERTNMSEYLVLITKVLCNKLSFVQLRLYINIAVTGLQDVQDQSSSGVAQILATLFALRGHQFHQHINEILDSIYRRLEKVTHLDTRRYSIESICNLAKHNIVAVIDALMTYPLPYDKNICMTLQRIGCEGDLCAASLTHFTHILERTQFFTDHENATQEKVRMATLPTLTAVCSMKELLFNLGTKKYSLLDIDDVVEAEQEFNVTGSQQIVNERLPSLVALLLLAYGSYIETVAPLYQSSADASKSSKASFIPNRNATVLVPSKCALECLLVLVGVSGCSHLEEALSAELLNPNADSVDDFLQALSTIALLFAVEVPVHISSLVAYLDTHHNHEIQRMTVAAVFGELVAVKCCGDFELLEIVTSGLLSKLNDKSSHVRRLVVKGIANFARLRKEEMSDKMNEVISALVGSTDLREGNDAATECQVALEAMKGLASLLPHLPPPLIIHHAPTLLIRIRLFVEKNSGEVREASMGVLRGLSVSVGDSEEFREQINSHLLTAVVHLQDPHPSMVVMCKSALRSMGTRMGSKDIEKLFGEHLVLDKVLNYKKFVEGLAKILTKNSSDQISLFLQITSSYFRHTEPTIRSASVLLAGCMVNHSTNIDVSSSLPRISHGIVYLLKDFDPSVRAAAAAVVPLMAKHEKVL